MRYFPALTSGIIGIVFGQHNFFHSGEHESAASSLTGICVIMRQCSARNIYCAKRYIFTRLRQSLCCIAAQIQPILLCIACQNDRHPVVDEANLFGGLTR